MICGRCGDDERICGHADGKADQEIAREDIAMTIELSTEEYERLLMVLGFAMAKAISRPDTTRMVLLTVNAVCRSSPSFVPYEVEPQ